MSYAKDDISVSNDLSPIQGVYYQSRVVEKQEQDSSSSAEKEIKAEELELSEGFEEKVKNIKEDSVKLQETQNMLETAQGGLRSIQHSVEEMKQIVKDAEQKENLSKEDLQQTSDSLNKELENVKKIAQETSFNNQKVLDESANQNSELTNVLKDASPEALGMPEKVKIEEKEEIKVISEQIEKSSQELVERQEQIRAEQERLIEPVTSNIVIESALDVEDYSITDKGYEKVKDDAISAITSQPDESLKVQVSTLNKNIILALVSLHP